MTRQNATHAAKVAGKKGFSLISDEKFRELYAILLRCGMMGERLQAYRSFERWAGREVTTAGMAACLCPGDTVTLTPRGSLASYIQNGMLKLDQAPSNSPIPHLAATTGDALSHKLEKLGHVAVVYSTCPPREPGPVRGNPGCHEPEHMREIFAAAAKQSLPALYVLDGAPDATACGSIPVIRVDGADAVAMYRVAFEAIKRARDGGGPTIIDSAAWPLGGHQADPLRRLEQYLAGKKLFRASWKKQLEDRYKKELDAAMNAVGLR